jgi:hypothetical protein
MSSQDVVAASRGPSAAQMNSTINEETSVIHPTHSLSAAQVTADAGFTAVSYRIKAGAHHIETNRTEPNPNEPAKISPNFIF